MENKNKWYGKNFMAPRFSNKQHNLHPELGTEVLISLLKERAKEAEKERKHMEKAEQIALERVQEEKNRLIELLEEEIERNEKAARLAKAKRDQADREQAILKRRRTIAHQKGLI